jgi:hypothetical protein
LQNVSSHFLVKPYKNEDTVELESDDESEQEYCVIYRPDEDPQNNTNSDAHHVDSDQARTINFTDDVMLVVVVLVTILELLVHLPIPQVIVSVSALSSGTSELCSSVF